MRLYRDQRVRHHKPPHEFHRIYGQGFPLLYRPAHPCDGAVSLPVVSLVPLIRPVAGGAAAPQDVAVASAAMNPATRAASMGAIRDLRTQMALPHPRFV